MVQAGGRLAAGEKVSGAQNESRRNVAAVMARARRWDCTEAPEEMGCLPDPVLGSLPTLTLGSRAITRRLNHRSTGNAKRGGETGDCGERGESHSTADERRWTQIRIQATSRGKPGAGSQTIESVFSSALI